MAAHPLSAPKLDPASVAVARLRVGRVPVDWLSGGYCAQCGPVLLPGAGQDYVNILPALKGGEDVKSVIAEETVPRQ